MKTLKLKIASDSNFFLQGIQHKPGTAIILDHDWVHNYIGSARIYVEEGFLWMEAYFPEIFPLPTDFLQRTPSLGGEVLEQRGNCVRCFRVHEVSLCINPNVDPAIRSIEEQIKENPETWQNLFMNS